MRAELRKVRLSLTREGHPFERAAQLILDSLHARQEKMK
jgi:hypothetical protein